MSPASVVPGGVMVPRVGISIVLQNEAVVRAFGHAVGLPGRITIKPSVGGKRGVVGVDGVE
jgi:hypothetical protein